MEVYRKVIYGGWDICQFTRCQPPHFTSGVLHWRCADSNSLAQFGRGALLCWRAAYYPLTKNFWVGVDLCRMGRNEMEGSFCVVVVCVRYVNVRSVELLVVTKGGRFVGKKSVVAMVEHGGCKFTHDGFGLEVQIPHNDIAVPATKHPNGAVINISIEEGHVSAGAE
jgi:hypothetical protein